MWCYKNGRKTWPGHNVVTILCDSAKGTNQKYGTKVFKIKNLPFLVGWSKMKDIFYQLKVNELKETKQNIIIFDSSYFLPNTGINAIKSITMNILKMRYFLTLIRFRIQIITFHICSHLKMFLKHICKNWD